MRKRMRHGTLSMHRWGHCRCDACRGVVNEKQANMRLRRMSLRQCIACMSALAEGSSLYCEKHREANRLRVAAYRARKKTA